MSVFFVVFKRLNNCFFKSGFDVDEQLSGERAPHQGQHQSAMDWPGDLAEARHRNRTHAHG